MNIDEELNRLEDGLRKLKIEYEAYFSGGSPRPPHDLVFRVERIIKKYSGAGLELSFRQRFRFNQLTQSYAVHNDLWRKKLKLKEEGPPSSRATGARDRGADCFRISWSEPEREREKVDHLFQAVLNARARTGELTETMDPDLFASFIREKTQQFKRSLECDRVCFSVTVEQGRVKLRVAKDEA